MAARPVVTTPVSAIPEVSGNAAVYAAAETPTRSPTGCSESLRWPRTCVPGELRAAGYTWERTAEGLIDLYRRATGAD